MGGGLAAEEAVNPAYYGQTGMVLWAITVKFLGNNPIVTVAEAAMLSSNGFIRCSLD